MKIELSETEIIHIMDSLRERINDLRGEAGRCGFEESADLADELEELEHDLFEASARPGDWTDPEDPDLFMDPVDFAAKHDVEPDQVVICDAEINAETQMFNAGAEARERTKESSRAADRRNFNLKVRDRRLSKAQTHDVWDANDPKNW